MTAMLPSALGPDVAAILRAEENQNLQQQPAVPETGANLQHSDRHNIPVTGVVKGPQSMVAESTDAERSIVTSIPPPPYPDPGSYSSLGAGSHDPSAQVSYLPDHELEASGDDIPNPQQLPDLDLETDPFYRDIRAQVEGRTPKGCLPSFCIGFNKGSYRVHEFCCSPLLSSKRKATPGESVHMQRAFLCGWRMLSATIFPLVPNQYIRCLWSFVQFVLFAVLASLSIIAAILTDTEYFDIVQLICAAIGVALTFVDVIANLYVLQKSNFAWYVHRNPEGQPLLAGEHQRGQFLSWLSKYNDLVRLVVTEMISYVTLVFSFPCSTSSIEFQNETFTCVEKLDTAVLSIAVTVALVCVCLAQFLIVLRILLCVVRQQSLQSPLSPVFIHLFLYLLGQRAIQATIFYSLYSWYYQVFYPFGALIIAYFFPLTGLLVFLAMDYGWVEDLCTACCGEYLGRLKHLTMTPQASQAVKCEIEGILQYFDYQKLRKDLNQLAHGYFVRNFMYPIRSPLVMLYCIPYLVNFVTFYGFYYYSTYGFARSRELYIIYVTILQFLIVNIHFVVMVLFHIFSVVLIPLFHLVKRMLA